MDHRGGHRPRGAPMHQFRGQRGAQHHPPPQLQQRMMNMNQPWHAANNMNTYRTQDESMNYPQQPPDGMNYPPQPTEGINYFQQPPDGMSYQQQPPYGHTEAYNNFAYPQGLPSPEMINTTPQTSFPPFSQHMYVQNPIFVDPMYPLQQPIPTHTPPMPHVESSVSPRKIMHFNSKENIYICSNCCHKNSLAETEIIKRDEQIQSYKKENELYQNENDNLRSENKSLRSQLESLQVRLKELTSVSKDHTVEDNDPENVTKLILENKNNSVDYVLSPSAEEFKPKTNDEELIMPATSPAPHEVPVVSAKGVYEEEDTTPTLENETQVDEAVFEQTAESEPADIPASPVPIENMESNTVELPKADGEWNEEAPVVTTTPVVQQDPAPVEQQNSQQDPITPVEQQSQQEPPHRPYTNQQRRIGNRGGGYNNRGEQLPGYGRGRRNYNQDQPDWRANNDRGRPPHSYSGNPAYSNRYKNDRSGAQNSQAYQQQENQTSQAFQHQGNRNSQRPEERRKFDNLPKDKNTHQPRLKQEEESWDNPSKDEFQKSNEKSNHTRYEERKVQQRHSTERPSKHPCPSDSLNKDGIVPNQAVDNGIQGTSKRAYNSTEDEAPNIVTEQDGDLFTAPVEFSLAHCVAADFRMGSGIAVKFKNDFGKVGELLDQNVGVGGCAHLEDKNRFIFYLVTKEISSKKPQFENLVNSLRAMKSKCLEFGVKKLAMPRIGCGLDNLDWQCVKRAINKVFRDTDIEIRIYEFNVEGLPESEGNKAPEKAVFVKYNIMKLVNIQSETALLFLGTEDGYIDPTAESLNEKHRFVQDYIQTKKTLGQTICVKQSKNYEYVYCLVIAKSVKDKVKFSNVQSCCSTLSRLLRKEGFQYVGIEAPQASWGGDDKVFFYKILTMLRNTLAKHMKLWVCFPEAEMDIYKLVKEHTVANK